MGLDWMVERTESGVDPMATAGAMKLDGNNPKSVEAFREVYDSWQEDIAVWGEDAPEALTNRWQRPFSEVLSEFEGCYLGNTVPENCPGLAPVTGLVSGALDFRGKVVANDPDMPEALANRCYADMTPDDALHLADEIEELDGTEDGGPLRAAVDWLRFWGGNGHPIHAWF